jgi:hypothetical protein
VLVVNLPGKSPKVVYVASKRNVARKGTKRKATFVPPFVRDAMMDAIQSDYCIKRQGIVGYDIGMDGEANYSPRFDRAEDKLDMDVADAVVKLLI